MKDLNRYKNLLLGSLMGILIGCESPEKIHISENLIPNPGFEIGEGDIENPEGWVIDIGINRTTTNWFMINTESPRHHQLGVDTTEFHSGTSSYKISRTWTYAGQTTGITLENPIPINPRKKYQLSFWYKTEGIHEYPIPLIVEFITDSEPGSVTDSIRTEKRVPNSDDWQKYYILLEPNHFPPSANDIRITFFTWLSTQGSIWLDDVEFREANEHDVQMYEQWRRQPVPSLETTAGGIEFTATGFYRVEQVDERWWLIDPEGNPTWAASIVGETPTPDNPNDPVTQTAWFKEKYGATPESVAQKMYDIYIDLGFNAFAGWTRDPHFAEITEKRYDAGQPYLPMVEVLGLIRGGGRSVKAMDRNGVIPSEDNRWMVDPFNPQWRIEAREIAEERIPRYKDKPWFMGWFVDNEIFYHELYNYIWAEYSSKEFIKLLEEKYNGIESLNEAWTSSFGEYTYDAFDDILIDKPEPKDWDDPLWEDFVAMERHMIEEYVNYTYNLVKELDPNHLIISNRFHWRAKPNLYRHIDLWDIYDVVAMNIYPNNNEIGYDSGEIEVMKMLYEGTKRPIIFGEFSVPAFDSNLYEFGLDHYDRPLDWSWHQVMRTQAERAESYEIAMKQKALLNFMIGTTWFKTLDPDSPIRRSNRGLMNSNYQLYRELTDQMRKTNEEIKDKLELRW